MTEHLERLLTAEEAAAATGIPRSSLYRLLATGAIPCVRYGRRAVRVTEAALERWIQESSTEPRVRPGRTDEKLLRP